jgi:hypothetical protein
MRVIQKEMHKRPSRTNRIPPTRRVEKLRREKPGNLSILDILDNSPLRGFNQAQ